MRIVFVGTVKFSRHCLKQVLACGGDVRGVFTLDERHASFHSDYARLAPVAERHGVPVHHIRNINDASTAEEVRSLRPEVIFVFGWSQIVRSELLAIPPLGWIGTHPAMLPRNRGRHPIVWTLVEGLEKSGLTFFYLDEGADSGDILWQRSFPITLEDDAGSVYRKIEALADDAIREFLPRLADGSAPRTPQDHSKATIWRKRSAEDGWIHWDAPTMTTYNLVRALARPYVGAETTANGGVLRVWRARLPDTPLPPSSSSHLPGVVLARRDGEFDVRTGDGYLTVVECEAPNGAQPAVGTRLVERA